MNVERLDEIRQRVEQLVRIANNPYCLGPAALLDGVKEIVPALLSEVDALNELLTASKAGQVTLQKAWEQDKDELTARAEAAEAERDAAVEDMTAVLKRDSDDICAYCKNRVECEGQQCEKYSSGVGDVDGNYPDWKWTCEDFDYGTCRMMENTPCNGCLENDCSGFEWRGPQAGKGDAPNE
jgi:hypothetical protein